MSDVTLHALQLLETIAKLGDVAPSKSFTQLHAFQHAAQTGMPTTIERPAHFFVARFEKPRNSRNYLFSVKNGFDEIFMTADSRGVIASESPNAVSKLMLANIVAQRILRSELAAKQAEEQAVNEAGLGPVKAERNAEGGLKATTSHGIQINDDSPSGGYPCTTVTAKDIEQRQQIDAALQRAGLKFLVLEEPLRGEVEGKDWRGKPVMERVNVDVNGKPLPRGSAAIMRETVALSVPEQTPDKVIRALADGGVVPQSTGEALLGAYQKAASEYAAGIGRPVERAVAAVFSASAPV